MRDTVLVGVTGGSEWVGQPCGLQVKASFVEGTVQLEGTVDDTVTRSGDCCWARYRIHK